MKTHQNLFEVIELFGGGTPKTTKSEYWNGGIPWLSVVDFNTGKKYVYKTEKTITEKGLEESSTQILPSGSIIISARGTVGALAVLKKSMAFNQSCYGICGIDGRSYTDYIYYALKYNLSEFLQQAHGGVFSTITKDTFKNIEIYLPSFTVQRAIAAVLSNLDDKIDLLQRQNATLEAMSEALFKQWFVVEAKEEWEEKKLSDIIRLVGGGTPKTSVKNYWEGTIPWVSGADIASHHKKFIFSSEKFISEAGLNNSAARLIPQYATLITARGTVGKFCLAGKPMAFSQTNYGILPKNNQNFFFIYLLIGYVVNTLKAAAYGSVFDTITSRLFDELSIALPGENIINEFDLKVKIFFEKIFTNQIQIQTLEKLRDTLLPKLMSGEVRVALD